MSYTEIQDIADKVVALISDQSFSQEISVARDWKPVLDMEDTENGYVVRVVPANLDRKLVMRPNRYQHDYQIHVGILRNLEISNEDTQIDACHTLVLEILEYLDGLVLTSPMDTIKWRDNQVPVLVDLEHLRTSRRFFSVIVATFTDVTG
jgi:hypothetical protein